MRLLLSLILFTIWKVASGCPPAESIAPSCNCKDLGIGPMMVCQNLYSPEELIAPISATKSMKMFSLVIFNSSLTYIPSDLFLGTRFHEIRFTHTQLMALSDSQKAFQGLEYELRELKLTSDDFVGDWEWSQLRDLRRLRLIDVEGVSMHTFTEPFPVLKSLSVLRMSRAEISFLPNKVFAGLENLRILNLKDNSISQMDRSMLPRPAENLIALDLSRNRLSSFPTDFFEEMPNLAQLSLDSNIFTILDEATFSWPMKHLKMFTIRKNKLRCDCRMKWVTLQARPSVLEGKCEDPELFKGTKLKYLDLRNLDCPKQQ